MASSDPTKITRRVAITALAAVAAAPATTAVPALANLLAHGDSELLDLVEQYLAAYAEQDRLGTEFGRIEEGCWAKEKSSLPEAMHARPEDKALGLPEPSEPGSPAYAGYHYLPYDIDNLRRLQWCSDFENTKTQDESVLRVRWITPSPEARSRADEIIAAYDAWKKKNRDPRSLRAAKRKHDAAAARSYKLAERIFKTPATTIEGMMAKARCFAVQFPDNKIVLRNDDYEDRFGFSIASDLLKLAGQIG